MAPYLRPPCFGACPIVLGAHRFFRDPASNLGGVGDLVQGFDGTHGWMLQPMTGPMLKQGRRGVLGDVPWLRPLLTTRTVAIYATPSLAEGAKSCYKAT
jgi:hypothetical protein